MKRIFSSTFFMMLICLNSYAFSIGGDMDEKMIIVNTENQATLSSSKLECCLCQKEFKSDELYLFTNNQVMGIGGNYRSGNSSVGSYQCIGGWSNEKKTYVITGWSGPTALGMRIAPVCKECKEKYEFNGYLRSPK